MRGGEHAFGKNAVSSRRIVDKNVRDCADEHTVLNNGAAAHSLDDPAGLRGEAAVGDMDHEVFALDIVAVINFFDDGVVILRFSTVDCGQNFYGAGFYVLFHRYFQRVPAGGESRVP